MKKVIAILMAVCMLLTILPVSVFAEEPAKKKYVALGDSYSNGCGINGYYGYFPGDPEEYDNTYGYGVAVENTYAQLFAEANDYEYIPLCYSAMRSGELRYLLDESYEGDQFTKRVFLNHGLFYRNYNLINAEHEENDAVIIEKIRTQYIEAIQSADVISIGLGTNDFCNYVTSRIGGLLGIYSEKDNDHVEDLVLDEQLKLQVASLRQMLQEKLAELLENDTTSAFINEVIDSFLYAYANFAISMKADFKLIRELNPTAQLIIVGLPDPEDGFVIQYGDTQISLGEIMKFMNGMMDLLQTTYTYQDKNCYFAEIPNHVTSFFDELKVNEISDDLLESFLCAFFYDSVKATVPAINMDILVAVMKNIRENGSSSINYAGFGGVYAMLEQVIGYFHNASIMDTVDIKAILENMGPLVQLLDSSNMLEDSMTLSAQSQEMASAVVSMVHIYGRFMLNNGVISHPDRQGHEEIYSAVCNALDNKITSKAYVDGKMNKFSSYLMQKFPTILSKAGSLINQLGQTFYQSYASTVCQNGHAWRLPTWNWSEDYSSATATFHCAKCFEHTATVTDTEITVKTLSSAMNTTLVYTATVELDGKTYTAMKTVVQPKRMSIEKLLSPLVRFVRFLFGR